MVSLESLQLINNCTGMNERASVNKELSYTATVSYLTVPQVPVRECEQVVTHSEIFKLTEPNPRFIECSEA